MSAVGTVGAVFRVAAIIRVAALFGALKIIFSDLFFFFWWPFFELKVKTAIFLKLAAAAAVVDLDQ